MFAFVFKKFATSTADQPLAETVGCIHRESALGTRTSRLRCASWSIGQDRLAIYTRALLRRDLLLRDLTVPEML